MMNLTSRSLHTSLAMNKVVEYVGFFHLLKERVKESWTQFWHSEVQSSEISSRNGFVDDRESNFRMKVKERLERFKHQTIRKIDRSSSVDEDFSHITRPKSRKELFQISAAVMGIEFSYAAETAFVSPLLLNIGLRHRHMTLMWCLSPLVGFFLTPILGSLSDGCRSQLGRRRPFILLLSIGIILGLILVPNGKAIGKTLGDTYKRDMLPTQFASVESEASVPHGPKPLPFPIPDKLFKSNLAGRSENLKLNTNNSISSKESAGLLYENATTHSPKLVPVVNANKLPEKQNPNYQATDGKAAHPLIESLSVETPRNLKNSLGDADIIDSKKEASKNEEDDESLALHDHPWGIIFTVLGTVLLDFDADACQSPSRAYMLDVTIPEDHAKGLSAFTVMAGLGGCLGYILGALNWEDTFVGDIFGGQVRAVFTLVLFIFVACVITTIRSFREIPLEKLWMTSDEFKHATVTVPSSYERFAEDPEYDDTSCKKYGSTSGVQETTFSKEKTEQEGKRGSSEETSSEMPTFREYIKTIVNLPISLQWLCLTNFFCWISLVCYSLYFTDFVGEAVFNGDPTAALGTLARKNYDDGVRFGCWGMSLYSLSCSLYSLGIENLVSRFGARNVYIKGQLVYSVGMVLMALSRHPVGVIVFSWTAGIMYATLFTMPYLLVARYHASETFDINVDDLVAKPTQIRGLGTDVAIVSSMVFLAQIVQALILGSLVAMVGSTTAIVCAASVFAFCGSISATKVLYLDL